VQQSQEEIKKWLEEHKEQVLKITKVENGDLDLAAIKLKGVSFVQHRHTDDYLSTQALLLRGEGTVSTPHGRESLPGAAFEIALTDNWDGRRDGNSLHLKTERASYTIEPAEGQ
jgi:hypothetical protein